jgi:poly(ADP-ribose) glycohydrolase ARH3
MTSVDMTDRWRGALLGTALGDAVGAPFEGRMHVDPVEVQRWLDNTHPLRWTDDTAMTIALAQSLVDCGGIVDPQHLGDTFAATYHAEPWRGYGPGPPRVFAAAADGISYLEAAAAMFGGTGSFGNGGAMRAAPAAIVGFPDLARVAEVARAQASVTHAHPLGQDGAALQAMAVMVAASMTTDGLTDALVELGDHLETREFTQALTEAIDVAHASDPAEIAQRLGNGIAAREAVPAAIAAFLRHPTDPIATVTTAICLGGDTDTIAAMAGAMGGAHAGASAVPDTIVDRLEGANTLIDLADSLRTISQGR